MGHSLDPGCADALARAVGHEAPFSDEELAAVSSLTVRGARELSALSKCVALARLRLVACELDDLMGLAMLSEISHLEVIATKLGSLMGLQTEAKLERIDLLYTSVQDASELLGIATWRRGVLAGNPWDETSFGALRNEARRPDMFFDLPSEYDWEQCRALWERVEACCGYLADAHGFLIRPGAPVLTPNTFDALRVETAVAARALRDPGFSLAALFSSYANQISAATDDELVDLARSRTLHASTELLAAVDTEQALDPTSRDALARLAKRFPSVTFFSLSDNELERVESARMVTLPGWYRSIARLVAGWLPRPGSAPVRFDGFEGYSPCQDRVASLAYMLGLRGAGDDTAPALRAAGIQIVGLSQEHPQSTLAIRLRDDDPQVYEYSEEDLLDALGAGRAATSVMAPVFPSYAAMLGHIVSMHPRGEAAINATYTLPPDTQ